MVQCPDCHDDISGGFVGECPTCDNIGQWACSVCGPHPASTATWCAKGCGRDYQLMAYMSDPHAIRIMHTLKRDHNNYGVECTCGWQWPGIVREEDDPASIAKCEGLFADHLKRPPTAIPNADGEMVDVRDLGDSRPLDAEIAPSNIGQVMHNGEFRAAVAPWIGAEVMEVTSASEDHARGLLAAILDDVVSHDEIAAFLDIPRTPREMPLGLSEIAQLCGVSRRTPEVWRARGVLPEPDGMVSGSPLWWRSTIESWAAATGRHTQTS